MRGWSTWIAVMVGACYAPRPTGDCEVICSAAEGDRCPDGVTCGASGLCSTSGTACAGDDAPGRCFGTGIAKPCVPAVRQGMLILSGRLDTDTDSRCASVAQPMLGPKLCVIASERIVVGGPVHAVGTRPLVLVATETIAVDAMLDARSLRTETVTGAGANSCPTPAGVGEAGTGSGGAGGSFQGRGGSGGSTSSVPATMAEAPVAFPDHVRGGCPGGVGGVGTTNMLGRPGGGGGALYLIADQMIDVQGVIAANGAGGFLAPPDVGARPGGGGGGGGAGGMIVLEAPVVRLGSAARLLAVGGAGGGGGGNAPGLAGGDPEPTASPIASITAAGGLGGAPSGGRGGDGSSMTSFDGAPGASGGSGMSDGGGGGGGGGAGFIMLMCTTCSTAGALIVPLPTS